MSYNSTLFSLKLFVKNCSNNCVIADILELVHAFTNYERQPKKTKNSKQKTWSGLKDVPKKIAVTSVSCGTKGLLCG